MVDLMDQTCKECGKQAAFELDEKWYCKEHWPKVGKNFTVHLDKVPAYEKDGDTIRL
jgi:hypothetical protein